MLELAGHPEPLVRGDVIHAPAGPQDPGPLPPDREENRHCSLAAGWQRRLRAHSRLDNLEDHASQPASGRDWMFWALVTAHPGVFAEAAGKSVKCPDLAGCRRVNRRYPARGAQGEGR